MFQTVHLECHQQRSPRPHFGSLQRSPDPLAGLRGTTSKGRGRERRGVEGDGRGGGGEERGRGGKCPPPFLKS